MDGFASPIEWSPVDGSNSTSEKKGQVASDEHAITTWVIMAVRQWFVLSSPMSRASVKGKIRGEEITVGKGEKEPYVHFHQFSV